MKRAIRIIIPIVLALAIILCMAWYLFIYDRAFTRDMLLSGARFFERNGNNELAAWFYDRAYDQASDSDAVAIELAEQYCKIGNYTRAEYTLYKALEDNATTQLYIALCRTYVQQDKLLDAVQLLSSIRNPEITQELDALRPSAPVAAPTPGFYSQYISVTLQSESGILYVNADQEYPSLKNDPYTTPIALKDGENVIYALSVNDEGLVSPLSIFGYTIGGVIEEVKFTDAAMESAIREALDVPAEKVLYTNDLWKITEFTTPKNAASFADLSYLTFVTKLTVDSGASGTLGSLNAMTNLTELNIQNVAVTADELAVIGNLPMLESLTLKNCSLSTTAGLENAKKLTYLDLSGNTIRNIDAISSMAMLKEANLQHNAIVDVTPLAANTALTKLDLSFNAITSLSPICSNALLTWLDAGNNALTQLDNIGKLQGLQYFSAASNKLSGIGTLASCTELTELNICANEITDISALSALNKVATLNFSNNKVTTLPAFSKDCALVTIDGSHNELSSLDPLSGLGKLNIVNMDYNANISSVSSLSKCHVLIQVNVYGTKVTDVSALTSQSIIVNFDPTQ